MTRIVAGSLGGRRIATPKGEGTRPTADRVREALFSTLETMVELAGCRFADLYAGSGAVGLEAASRGAAHVLLVEPDARAARIVRANIAALELTGRCRVQTARLPGALVGGPDDGPYDVVFADPPYAVPGEHLRDLMEALVVHRWLAPGAVLVLERSARSAPPEPVDGITEVRSRRYGESVLWYFRRADPAEQEGVR